MDCNNETGLIVIVRHVDVNEHEVVLTEKGKVQLESLLSRIKDLINEDESLVVVTSSAIRAILTALHIATDNSERNVRSYHELWMDDRYGEEVFTAVNLVEKLLPKKGNMVIVSHMDGVAGITMELIKRMFDKEMKLYSKKKR
jgi:phosphohistidine phosphatase SixA